MNSAYDSTLNASQDARQQKFLQLNQQARKLLSSCPKRPARGVNQRLFEPARILQRSPFRLKQEKVFSLIKDAVEHCGRYVGEREIWDAIKTSAPSNHKDNGKGPPYKKKGATPASPECLYDFAKKHPFNHQDLRNKRPDEIKAGVILRDLFGEDAVLSAYAVKYCIPIEAPSIGFRFSGYLANAVPAKARLRRMSNIAASKMMGLN